MSGHESSERTPTDLTPPPRGVAPGEFKRVEVGVRPLGSTTVSFQREDESAVQVPTTFSEWMEQVRREASTPHGPARCECGRYAKWVGDRHYYDGTYDCYSYTVDCTHCGPVTVECV